MFLVAPRSSSENKGKRDIMKEAFNLCRNHVISSAIWNK